jgi:hypothetical protein
MSKLLEKYKKLLPKYLVAAVIIIVPLFPKFPLFSIPGTYVAVRFEDLLLLILGIITFAKIISDRKRFFKDEITQAFLIFFGVNLISLISGVFLTKTATLHIGLLNYFRRVEYLIPFFAVLTLFDFKELKVNLNYYLKIFIIVTIVAFIYGLGQRYKAFPVIITQNDQYSKGVALRWTQGSHISSTFAGHYDLAATMTIFLPVFIVFFFTLKNYRDKFWLFLASGGGLWLLINSLSRISQVSYLAAVSVALLLARKFKVFAVVFVLSVILIGQSPSLQARFMRVIDVFYQRIKSVSSMTFTSGFEVRAQALTPPAIRANLATPTTTPAPVFEDRSTSIRLKVEWPRAIRAFKINPLLGTGYSSITMATDNDFLRMLGETGLLGFLAFMLIFARIGKHYVKGLSKFKEMSLLEKGFIVGVIGGVVGTFIGAFFIDLFEASKFAILFWFVLAYGLALARNYSDES